MPHDGVRRLRHPQHGQHVMHPDDVRAAVDGHRHRQARSPTRRTRPRDRRLGGTASTPPSSSPSWWRRVRTRAKCSSATTATTTTARGASVGRRRRRRQRAAMAIAASRQVTRSGKRVRSCRRAGSRSWSRRPSRGATRGGAGRSSLDQVCCRRDYVRQARDYVRRPRDYVRRPTGLRPATHGTASGDPRDCVKSLAHANDAVSGRE